MKEKRILDAMEGVRAEYIEEAVLGQPIRKSRGLAKWGVLAACLCTVIAAAIVLPGIARQISKPGGDVPGSNTYSVAVYPIGAPGKNEENVASADVFRLTEADLAEEPLARHLPAVLPDGYHFRSGSLYKTVMKDGTEYQMLRVDYSNGTVSDTQQSEDGEVIAPNPDDLGDAFIVCVRNFVVDPSETMYASGQEVPLSVLESEGQVQLQAGDCNVTLHVDTADPGDVLAAAQSVS